MPLRSFTLTTALGHTVRGDLHALDETTPCATVIICHGWKGFKDWGFFPTLAEQLAVAGFTAIRFNFSHDGVGEDFLNFTRLDLFEHNTYAIELDDLQAVIDWAVGQREVDPTGLALLGHSRGGATALIKAFSDKEPRIRAAVTWAAVSRLNRFPEQVLKMWREHGFFGVFNARTGQEMIMRTDILDDYEANRERYDFVPHLASRELPLLVIHGTADESVPAADATEISSHANAVTTKLHLIEGANHSFGARHPYLELSPHLAEAIAVSKDWLAQQLGLEG